MLEITFQWNFHLKRENSRVSGVCRVEVLNFFGSCSQMAPSSKTKVFRENLGSVRRYVPFTKSFFIPCLRHFHGTLCFWYLDNLARLSNLLHFFNPFLRWRKHVGCNKYFILYAICNLVLDLLEGCFFVIHCKFCSL